MAINDFSNQNIQDTYQRVVQTDGTNRLADGTGSFFIPVSSSHAITASHALFAVSASHEITIEISSSHAINADTASFATNFTASGNISSSGIITANRFDIDGNKFATLQSTDIFDIGQTGQASLNLTNVTASGDISSSGLITALSMSGDGSNLTGIVSASHAETSDTALVATNGFSNALTVGTGVDLSGGAVNFDGSSARTLTLDLTEVITDDGVNRILTSDGDGTLTAESTFLVDGGAVTLNGSLSASSFLQTATLRGDQNLSTGLQVDGYVLAQNITASNNISASGYIIADDANFDGTIQVGLGGTNTDGIKIGPGGSESYLTNINGLRLQPNTADPNHSTTPHVTIGAGAHITASGNISASGTLTANTLRLTSTADANATSTDHAFQAGLTSDMNVIIDVNEVMARNNGSTADLHLNPDGGAVSFNNSVASIKVRIEEGHITASGNISASGNITAPQFRVGGNQSSSPVFITYHAAGDNLQIVGGGLFALGNITASQNISASGIGSFPELELDGFIKHTGDTNTQFGFVQNDEFSVTTAGTEMLQIDGTGTTFNVNAQDRDFKVSGDGGNLFILNDGSNRASFPTITEFRIGLSDATANATLEVGGNISSSGNIKTDSHITASGNIIATGTGSFGRLEATSGTALQLLNNQSIVFENAAGTEFGQIKMNTNDQMIFQNVRSNKDIFIRAGNAGNEGNVIIQKGGTETVIAKFGLAEGQYLSGSLTASGNISASGDLTINNINGTINGGTF